MSATDSTGIVYHGPHAGEWNDEGGGSRFDAWSVTVEHSTHSETFWFASEAAAVAHIADRWRG